MGEQGRNKAGVRHSAAAIAAALTTVAALVTGCTGGSNQAVSSPATTKSTAGSPTSSAPSGPNVCSFVSTAIVSRALRVPVKHARQESRKGTLGCTWTNAAGKPLASLTISGSLDLLLVRTLAHDGAFKYHGLGRTAVFAPRPPRLATRAGSYAALTTLEPAWYGKYLPKGKRNPISIPRATVIRPLATIEKAAIKTEG